MRYVIHVITVAICFLAIFNIMNLHAAFFSTVAASALNAMLLRERHGSTEYWLNALFFMLLVVVIGIKVVLK